MRYFNTPEQSSAPVLSASDVGEAGRPPVENSRARRKALTRERILRAANILFRKQGYEDAKTTDLASRVGVSHGTIFAHFDSKASILRELVLMRMRNELCELQTISANGRDATEKLKDFARKLWVRAYSAPELTAAYHSQSWLWSTSEEQEYRKLVESGQLLARNIIVKGLETGEISSSVNPDVVLEILQAKFFDCIRQAQYVQIGNGQEDTPDNAEHKNPYLVQLEEVIDYLLKG